LAAAATPPPSAAAAAAGGLCQAASTGVPWVTPGAVAKGSVLILESREGGYGLSACVLVHGGRLNGQCRMFWHVGIATPAAWARRYVALLNAVNDIAMHGCHVTFHMLCFCCFHHTP
jgi:hypothetical protein